MSHFTVMVIGDDVEGKLYPFHELECTLTREEIKEDPRCEFVVRIEKDDVRDYIAREVLRDVNGKLRRGEDGKVLSDDLMKKYYELLKEKDYAQILDDWDGLELNEETGQYGRYTNPKATWDWYQVGGRWTGALKLKKLGDVPKEFRSFYEFTETGKPGLMTEEAEAGWVDSAPKVLIDWDTLNNPSKEQRQRDYDFWTKYVIPCSTKEFEALSEHEQRNKISKIEKELGYATWYRAKYYKDRYKNRENYIRMNNMFSTYAVITEDGTWHAPGEMGWFGCSSESHEDSNRFHDTYFEKFIEPLSPETMITIVDCHI